MKKIISLILVLAICLSLCSCGKSEAVKKVEEQITAIGEVSLESKNAIDSAQQAFDALTEEDKAKVENYFQLVESQTALKELEELEEQRLIEEQEREKFEKGKETYDNIKASWYIVNQMGSDLYSIWHGCIFKKDEMSKNGIQFFVDNTSLNEKDVIEGLASRNYVNEQYAKTGIPWNDVGEDVKQFYRDGTIKLFEKASKQGLVPAMDDSLFSIVNAYALNGMVYNVRQALETAKQNMNELIDDSNYDSLKGFYLTTSNLLDFCMSPSGSFDQYKTLLNDYRLEARNYMNELDLIYG